MDCSPQRSLSMGFPRQEYWHALPSPPGNLSNLVIKPKYSALAGGFFTTEPPGKPPTGPGTVHNKYYPDFSPLRGPVEKMTTGVIHPLSTHLPLLSEGISRIRLPRWLAGKGICLPMQETWVRSLVQEYPREVEMATHCSILAWRIPWTEEPGGLQSMGSQRVRRDWICTHAHTHPKTLGLSCTSDSHKSWLEASGRGLPWEH